MLSLRTLPIIEHWDCHGCGLCCRDALVPLDDEDLARLEAQHWDAQPEYRDQKVTTKTRVSGAKVVLAQRDDGRCIFLQDDGRCHIHVMHGYDAKPTVCRQFPLQVVPLDGRAVVTTRRSCPSAAAEKGRPLTEHVDAVRTLLAANLERGGVRPPAILPGLLRDWTDLRRVTDALERMMCDTRFPLVRRIVHGLEFANLLEDCKLRRIRGIASSDFAELVHVFEGSALEVAGHWFGERQPPSRAVATAFRQAAGETLRLHPRIEARSGWSARWRMMRNVVALTRGKGRTPPLVPGYPQVEFAALDRPLGSLDLELLRPLDAYFQTFVASLRYATLGYARWSALEGFRAIALQLPMALWAWRWACPQSLSSDELIAIIGCLDRAHTCAPLIGWRHRRRMSALAASGALQRLVSWYAR